MESQLHLCAGSGCLRTHRALICSTGVVAGPSALRPLRQLPPCLPNLPAAHMLKPSTQVSLLLSRIWPMCQADDNRTRQARK